MFVTQLFAPLQKKLVESLLCHRDINYKAKAQKEQRRTAAQELESDEPREFLVKFKHRSYMHCEWISEAVLKVCQARVLQTDQPTTQI